MRSGERAWFRRKRSLPPPADGHINFRRHRGRRGRGRKRGGRAAEGGAQNRKRTRNYTPTQTARRRQSLRLHFACCHSLATLFQRPRAQSWEGCGGREALSALRTTRRVSARQLPVLRGPRAVFLRESEKGTPGQLIRKPMTCRSCQRALRWLLRRRRPDLARRRTQNI